jgi:hypothetical protein
MGRKIVFELGGARAIAEMHDEDVPKTCEAVWNILPVEGMSIHANWVGREIMLHLEGEKILRLPPEGPRTRGTAPGDIGYFYRAPGLLRGKQAAYSAQFQRELSEFEIYYGDPAGGGLAAHDPARYGRQSGLITTKFATLIDVPREFQRNSDDIRHNGLRKLVVARLEGSA